MGQRGKAVWGACKGPAWVAKAEKGTGKKGGEESEIHRQQAGGWVFSQRQAMKVGHKLTPRILNHLGILSLRPGEKAAVSNRDAQTPDPGF